MLMDKTKGLHRRPGEKTEAADSMLGDDVWAGVGQADSDGSLHTRGQRPCGRPGQSSVSEDHELLLVLGSRER